MFIEQRIFTTHESISLPIPFNSTSRHPRFILDGVHRAGRSFKRQSSVLFTSACSPFVSIAVRSRFDPRHIPLSTTKRQSSTLLTASQTPLRSNATDSCFDSRHLPSSRGVFPTALRTPIPLTATSSRSNPAQRPSIKNDPSIQHVPVIHPDSSPIDRDALLSPHEGL
jgi:hypothetical protein